ncbi:hypothetical protein H7171_04170, partial [Candidatus Saccharibacteria bacterium]|nr:hypothetical protein [Candidatus Saccharibacteria bacterium]
NAGGIQLFLKVAVSRTPTNTQHVDFSKVTVMFGSSSMISFTLAQLIAAQATGGMSLDKTLYAGNTTM